MTGTSFIIAQATITESTIFEVSQENWDTFIDYVCLGCISVYYFKVSQVFMRCVNEKVVGRKYRMIFLSAVVLALIRASVTTWFNGSDLTYCVLSRSDLTTLLNYQTILMCEE